MKRIGNDGFTLIEVLAVIVIVSLLSIIVIPNVMNTIGVGKSSSEEIMIDNIKTASEQMYEELEFLGSDSTLKDNNLVLVIENDSVTFHLQALVDNGFLTGNGAQLSDVLINPRTGDNIGGCEVKISKNSNGTYSFSYPSGRDGCPNLG